MTLEKLLQSVNYMTAKNAAKDKRARIFHIGPG